MRNLSSRPGDRVLNWLDDSARRLQRAGLGRAIPRIVSGESVIDLSGNDYANLAHHPRVIQAIADAAAAWGAGATGARLVSGNTTIHVQLEEELAAFHGVEAAILLSSGYMANLAALTALCRPRSLLVVDEFAHASLVDGCRLSGAETVTFSHNSPVAAGNLLTEYRRSRALVATESVFSVDGDVAPLQELLNVCRAHNAALLVDDAHGLGVLGNGGRGALVAAGLMRQPDVIATSSLGKSLSAQGGVVLGPRRVIDHVINTARPFLYDTALAPVSAAAALAAVHVLKHEPERANAARSMAVRLAALLAARGLAVSEPRAAVFSIRAPSAAHAVAWTSACRSNGVLVGCFRPPSVPDHQSRLRLGVHPGLDLARVERAADVIARYTPWEVPQGPGKVVSPGSS